MKIKDLVFTMEPALKSTLELGKHYTVEAIETDAFNNYYLVLEGVNGGLFPEEAFVIVPIEVEDPKAAILKELEVWRQELIDAENKDDKERQEKCKSYLDFFLDKYNLQKRFDAEAGERNERILEAQYDEKK